MLDKLRVSIRNSSQFATLNPFARDNNASISAGENPIHCILPLLYQLINIH